MSDEIKENILYTELAEWWPLFSAPGEYDEEVEIFRNTVITYSQYTPKTLLELGSAGGNIAFYLKNQFKITLVDPAAQMLEISRTLNPDCKHVQGDMRDIRSGQMFDVVFIHDAINYMITKEQLKQAITTAFVHCQPGGISLFVPDWTSEYFQPSTTHGGIDSGNKGLRYLQWTIDTDPKDNIYSFYISCLCKKGSQVRQSALEEHKWGLFSKNDWLKIIEETGFEAKVLPYKHSKFKEEVHFLFIGLKPK